MSNEEDAPRWITALLPGSRCFECGKRTSTGDRVLWYPKTHEIACEECGGEDLEVTEA